MARLVSIQSSSSGFKFHLEENARYPLLFLTFGIDLKTSIFIIFLRFFTLYFINSSEFLSLIESQYPLLRFFVSISNMFY